MRSLIEMFFGKWECVDVAASPAYNGIVMLFVHSVTGRKKGACDFEVSGRNDIPAERAERLIKEWKCRV